MVYKSNKNKFKNKLNLNIKDLWNFNLKTFFKINKSKLEKLEKFKFYLFLFSPFLLLDTAAALYYNSSLKNLEQKVIIKNEKISEIHEIKLKKALKAKYKKDNELANKIKQVKQDFYIIFPKYKNTIDSLFNDPRFKIYNKIAVKKKVYDDLPEDFYLRPEVGFFTQKGFEKAIKFFKKNKNALDEAVFRFNFLNPEKINEEKIKEILVSIQGIESNYGNFLGNYKLFNSLVSMYTYLNKKFAIKNLKALFKAMKNPFIKIDPFCESSFMGAIGNSQMMPIWLDDMTIINDLDNNNIFDPFSTADAIGFTAWYLYKSGVNRNFKTAINSYNSQKAFFKAISTFADSLHKIFRKEQQRNLLDSLYPRLYLDQIKNPWKELYNGKY